MSLSSEIDSKLIETFKPFLEAKLKIDQELLKILQENKVLFMRLEAELDALEVSRRMKGEEDFGKKK